MENLYLILAWLSGLSLVTLVGFILIWIDDREEIFPKDIEKFNNYLARKYGNKSIEFPLDE